MEEQTVFTGGSGYIVKKGFAGPMLDMGELDVLVLAHTKDKKSLPTNRTLTGGNRNSFELITAVEMAFKMYDFTAENMAMGLLGKNTAVVAGSVVDETNAAYKGGFIPFKYAGISGVNVQEVAGGLGTDLTVGIDYEVKPGGILILDGFTLPEGDNIFYDYDHVGVDITEAITASGEEYEFFFDGINKAQSGEPFTLRVPLWKPGIAENLNLITGEYAGLDMTGEVLADESKDGTTESQFYSLQKQSVA